jgi:hypothetical protein
MRLPFAVQSYQARSLPVSAQRTVNFYAEQAPPDAQTPIYLIGTPGLRLFAGLGSGPIRAMGSYGGILHVVSGATLYRVSSSGVATVLATVPATGSVYMGENNAQLGILVAASMYFWDGTTLTLVSDVDYPGASSFAVLDGYGIFTPSSGDTFFISDLNALASYDALDIASAEGSPDDLVRVFIDHRELWLFGAQTTEVWYNTGNADFPFSRIDGAFIERGILSANTVTKIDNTVFWWGDDRKMYRADGFRPQRVSTHAIEGLVSGYSTVSDAFCFAYSQDGHDFVVSTFPTEGATFVYDAATQLFHERESGTLGYWRPGFYQNLYGKHIVGDYIDGSLYEIDLDTYTENDTTIRRIATAAPIDGGGKRVFMPSIEMSVESGVGLTSGQGSDPQLMLDWSDDGGRTFGSERWASMGEIGEYSKRVRFTRMGSFRTRIYRLTVSDPVKSIVIGATA